MRRYERFLWVTGIAAALGLAQPALVAFFLLTVIGIPLALFMMTAPTLAMYLIPAHLIWRLMGRLPRIGPHAGGLPGWLAVMLALVGAGWGVSALSHRAVNASIDALVAGDVRLEKPPVIGGTVAFLHEWSSNDCTDFCQRLLLSGTADKVLLDYANDRSAPLQDTKPLTAWHMERRSICPEVDLGGWIYSLQIPGEPTDPNSLKPSDLMLQEMAAGNCLIEGQATLAEADAVIQHQWIRTDEDGHGTLAYRRSALFLRNDAGLTEVHRVTMAAGQAIAAPVIVIWPFDFVIRREVVLRNFESRDADLVRFAVETLGLSLAVVTEESDDLRQRQVEAIIAAGAPLTEAQVALVRRYMEMVDIRGPLSDRDRTLLLAVLQRDALEFGSSAARIMPDTDEAPAGFFQAVAEAVFAAVRAAADNPELQDDRQLGALANILSGLPARALAPWKQDLIAIARDPALRRQMLLALVRPADFGEEGAQVLLQLVTDAQALTGDESHAQWRMGMVGLCRMGPAAAGVLDPLVALFKAGKLPTSPGSQYLTMATFARMGLPKDRLAALWLPSLDAEGMKRLDWAYGDIGRADKCLG